jgi:hypothetical protein
VEALMKATCIGPTLLAAALISGCGAAEKTIGLGQAIHHDDFEYAVQLVVQTDHLGNKTPSGIFYLVTFRVENDAKRVDHVWTNDIAYLIDEWGHRYENDREAQQRLNDVAPFGYQDRYVTSAGEVATTQLVFDLPKAVKEPYLRVRGWTLMGDVFDGGQFRHTKVKLF